MCSTDLLSTALVIFILLPATIISHPPCGLYGAPPCQFLPAPPGQTPSCARPGRTYCEHVDTYPTYLIKHLVQKWGYDAKNLIIDETGEEFNAVRYHHHDISHFYDPSNIFNGPIANHLNQFDGYKYDAPNGHRNYPQPIYIPKPHDTDALSSPNFKQKGDNNGWIGPKVSQYNSADWLKRYARDLNRRARYEEHITPENSNNSTRNTKDVSHNKDFFDIFNGTKETKHRSKRQSPGRSTLCQTSSQFIMPQAALSSKGNWMFVVNQMDTARQLVKTETCASTVCSNLCQLPNGYNSRCEQKYVQKRLVALNSNGQNLYTDTFWFPSCCVCTLSNS